MSILLKAIYRFNAVIINIQMSIFTNIQHSPKICMEQKKKKKRERERVRQTKQITDSVLKKKNKAGGIILSDFKVYYKVTL